MSDSPESTVTAQPSPLIAARHVVGIALVSALQPAEVYAQGGFFATWGLAFAIALAIAGVITGLAWLFFTKRESGKSLQSFIASAWVISVLTVIGRWL